MKKIRLTYNNLADYITEEVKKYLSPSVLTEWYNPLGNINVDDVDKIEYTRDIDEEGDEDDDGNPIPYVTYDIECFDIQGDSLGYADNLNIDEIEEYFGENVAQEILNDDSDKGSVEGIIDVSISDINNVGEVNNVAKKMWHSYSYDDAPNERGYILTDGTFIYFGPNVDHMSISHVCKGMTVGKFVSLGNIRVSNNSFELEKEPTYAQRKALRILIQNNPNDDLYFDIAKYSGNGMYSGVLVTRHYKTHNARFVLGQIDNYFANGIKPKEYFEENKIIKEDFDIDEVVEIISENPDFINVAKRRDDTYSLTFYQTNGGNLGTINNLTFEDLQSILDNSSIEKIKSHDFSFKACQLTNYQINQNILSQLSEIRSIDDIYDDLSDYFEIVDYTDCVGARGYILPNGELVVFREDQDHIEINQVPFMTQSKMEDLGAIRCGENFFSLIQEPSPSQRIALKHLIAHANGCVLVDIDKHTPNNAYPTAICGAQFENKSPSFVLGILDNYFENGIKPKTYYTESRRRKLNIINEMVSPIVWHFTTPENLVSILQNNEFVLSDAYERASGMDQALTGWSDKHTYFLSTTRSKSSHDGYSKELKRKSSDGAVRIELDGNRLNTIAHGKASNFHGKRDLKYGDNTSIKGRYTDNFVNKDYTLSDIKNDKDYNQNEKEDTVWYHKEILNNASKFIRRIDVLVYTKTDIMDEIEELADNYGIPCYFYDNENAFNIQNDDYFDEDRLFQQCLQKAMEKINNSEGGWSPYYIFDDVVDVNGGEALKLSGKWNIMNDECEFISDTWYDDLNALMTDFGYEYY